ncbi:DUF58 domain-containing protein [Thiorhodococcus mannitoliphagus]|uniref:DUF58 domain-containing protein n=1 Tax=Thiorhodococcus mannitoliphagus TaxID=329406 RepID=A0A6P1DWP8_9GAMM|nr:DUF58 domain-containing protein [Thiorhodococcus mannitoliphagus]NEX21146.1 DUF58 domain-containing protein [Thiorhodococcus mannitoliphagus]
MIDPADNMAPGLRATLKELIGLRAQARRLDLAPRGRVLATRSGGHLSRFRGRGMEFDESRVYQPGDDPRNMDWRVTARAGTPHVKLFREERERPVWLLVDQGPSMRFGTRVAFKSVVAAQAAALLGWAAADRGDRVGGLVFDERAHLERRPAARGAGLLPLLDRLAAMPDTGEGGYASLEEAGGHLARLVRPGSLVAIVSDFFDLEADRGRWLNQLGDRGELLLILVHDPLESEVPPPGRYPVMSGVRRGVLDLTAKGAREAYHRQFAGRLVLLEQLARRNAFHLLKLATTDAVGPALALGLGARAVTRGREAGR